MITLVVQDWPLNRWFVLVAAVIWLFCLIVGLLFSKE